MANVNVQRQEHGEQAWVTTRRLMFRNEEGQGMVTRADLTEVGVIKEAFRILCTIWILPGEGWAATDLT